MNRVANFGTLKHLWTVFLDDNSREFARNAICPQTERFRNDCTNH